MVTNSERYSIKDEDIKIFTGNSNMELARDIAAHLEIPLSHAIVDRFENGEIKVKIEESVRGYEVFVIQSMCCPVSDNIMELLIMCDALERASATSVNVVVPYFGYAKQEKKTAGREPISAKLIANIMTVAGASRVVTMDLHAAAIQGFFDIPVDNLYALPLFVHYYYNKGLRGKDIVVVSPDAGGVARARHFAERLGTTMAVIFKRRPEPDQNEIIEMVGDVKGKKAIIIDDMISTGGTLVKGAEKLIEKGATEIYACATHPILAADAIKIINDSPITEVAITDTIPIPEAALRGKFVKISVASTFGEAIRRNFFNLSVSTLFDQKYK
ncbi:MAG: ribose-phosphate pyrophosphokinase [Candidatus Eremiobacteraeota bacterium]|nr:ribose-phosphate pyrophosphokinase [Candidatus Eremiobacteraeota bacterium]